MVLLHQPKRVFNRVGFSQDTVTINTKIPVRLAKDHKLKTTTSPSFKYVNKTPHLSAYR